MSQENVKLVRLVYEALIRLSANGKVTWQQWYGETDAWPKALEAVGLSE